MNDLSGNIKHFKDPTCRKMPVKGLCGTREIHVPSWSMICVTLKLNFKPLSASQKEF